MVQWGISWRLFDGSTSLFDNESVGNNFWPHNICRSLWPIFYIPVTLPYVLKTIWWMGCKRFDTESLKVKFHGFAISTHLAHKYFSCYWQSAIRRATLSCNSSYLSCFLFSNSSPKIKIIFIKTKTFLYTEVKKKSRVKFFSDFKVRGSNKLLIILGWYFRYLKSYQTFKEDRTCCRERSLDVHARRRNVRTGLFISRSCAIITYCQRNCPYHQWHSYEGCAKSSVTKRLPWFYPRCILKCFTALEWCVE